MEINYYGQSCFRIKGKDAVVVTDPFTEVPGLGKLATLSADIVTVSHDHSDHNNLKAVEGTPKRQNPFVINGPGEYEVQGVSVFGVSSYHDTSSGSQRGKNTIFTIAVDGVKIAHLGDLGHKLENKDLDLIGSVDILMIPVGGKVSLNPEQAIAVINQIEPKVVIPMHYGVEGTESEIKPVKAFMQEFGVETFTPVDRYSVLLQTLPIEREIVVLNVRH